MSSPPSDPAAAAAATPVVVAPKPTGVALYWAKYLKSLEKFPIRTKVEQKFQNRPVVSRLVVAEKAFMLKAAFQRLL